MPSQKIGRQWINLMRPQWPALAVGIICVMFVTAVELTIPLVFGRGVVDETLLGDGDPRLLTLLAGGVILLFAVKGLFGYGQVYFTSYVGNRTVHNLRERIFDHVMHLPASYFSQQGSGDIISRSTNDVGIIQTTVTNGIADIVRNGLLLIGISVMIVWLNWKLALVTVLILPLTAFVISVYGGRIRLQSGRLNERIGALTSIFSETLRGIRVVKAFTMESTQRDRFVHQNESGFEASMKSVRASATMSPVVELTVIIGFAIVIWVGGMQVLSGALSIGDLIAFMAYVGMVTPPITSLTRISVMMQQAIAASNRVFQLLDERPEVTDGTKSLPPVQGHIHFDNVSFAYEPGKPVLNKVDLHIKAGETVALVGPSGAGKSTLAGLIPRFFDPHKGKVTIDGHDIRHVSLKSLRKQMGYVPQDTVLFQMSIADNIRAGRRGYTDSQVEQAAKMANAHDFIMELANGYDTVVGEGGSTLSGGQKQRIAIARALLGDPRILLFDEATSNLDPESEHLIQEAFQRLLVGRTTLIIAHRPATIQAADKVIVMSKGAIVQQGNHNQLLASEGVYNRLFGDMDKAVGEWVAGQATGSVGV